MTTPKETLNLFLENYETAKKRAVILYHLKEISFPICRSFVAGIEKNKNFENKNFWLSEFGQLPAEVLDELGSKFKAKIPMKDTKLDFIVWPIVQNMRVLIEVLENRPSNLNFALEVVTKYMQFMSFRTDMKNISKELQQPFF